MVSKETQLFAEAQGGKSLADEITAVVEQYQAPLLRYAGRMLRNAVQAEDIVQDAFTKFVQYRYDSDESIRNVQAWLYRVKPCRATTRAASTAPPAAPEPQ